MMGVGELATAAMALVGPYLVKGAEELAKKVGGEVVPRVVKQLWDAVRGKLAGKEALADVEAKPDDQRRWSALELQLEKALEADPGFRDSVAKLVSEIPEDKRTAIQQIANVSGDRNVTTEIAGAGNQVNVGRP
jgi:hypothetical protein